MTRIYIRREFAATHDFAREAQQSFRFSRAGPKCIGMELDTLLVRFFGTDDITTLPEDQVVQGVERLRLQFGLEKDRGRRFALWSLMYLLGIAPDLDIAFEDPADRDAARNFMDMADREMRDDQ